jgi:rare lipoprotein A
LPKPLVYSFLLVMLVYARPVMAQEVGLASYYHDFFNGKRTASGELYNPGKLTAAHKFLPIGTLIKVTNLENDKSIIVRINDRGPYVKNRILDLSKSAAIQLGITTTGFARVTYTIIETLISLSDTASDATPEERFFTINDVDTTLKMQYGVKIGSYEDPRYVFSVSKDLKAKFGVIAYVQNVKLIKGTLYRIFVGNYLTQEEGEEMSKKLKKLYPDCKVVKYESFR